MRPPPSLTKRGKFGPPAEPAEVTPAKSTRSRHEGLVQRLLSWGRRVIAPAGVLLLAIGGFSWLTATGPKPVADIPQERSWPVAAKSVTVETVQPELVLYGRVRSSDPIEIRAGVDGFVAERGAEFVRGAVVQQGEMLVVIDDQDLALDLRHARAVLAESQARRSQLETGLQGARRLLEREQALLELSQSRLARQRRLRDRNVISVEALEVSESETEVARRSVVRAETELATAQSLLEQQRSVVSQARVIVERAQIEIGRTRITVSETSIVETALVSVGTRISVNMVLGSLIPLAGLEAEFRLSAEQYARSATDPAPLIGRRVEISWEDRFTFTGRITRLDPRVDDRGGGITVYADIENQGTDTPLRPGAFLTIQMPDRSFEQVVQLPASALMPDGNIYKIGPDQRLERKQFELVLRSGGMILVSGDFRNRDCIVLTHFGNIGVGVKVESDGCEAFQ